MEIKVEKQESLNDTSTIESRLNILIVEDNPGDVVIVRELMRETRTNFLLTHASNLKETFVLCSEKEFDVILLDLGLPESSSLETLRKIKVFMINSPIVVMTGLDDEDTALSALREGAQDYLVKNHLNSENILRSIKYSIERKKNQDILRKHTHQFSVLSSAAASVSMCDDIKSIFRLTCENISLLLENANAVALELEKNKIQVSCIDWLMPWYEDVKNHTLIDLNNQAFQISGQKNELLELFSDGMVHELKGGLHELMGGNIEQSECTILERIIRINYIYVFGFIKDENLYGGVIIFSQKMIADDSFKIIETLANHSSLNIQRRSIEKDLRISEYRYKKLNEELEHKVKERTQDLKAANQNLQHELNDRIRAEDALKKSEAQLRELIATKDKFFNIVAHDLKNPFTSLIGSSELLFNNIQKLDTESIHALALILNDSAKSGYAILQNLLDWSRSQTGLLKYNPERINLSKLIDENISNVQLYATNKKISIISEREENIYIITDNCMINTILRNLLSNAIKFTHRGGRVIINTKKINNEVIVSVKDNGTGISLENIEKLFRLDTKYSSPGTENEQGTGLGLKLSKEFVEKEGGRIWVESVVDQGSEFSFSIPLKNV